MRAGELDQSVTLLELERGQATTTGYPLEEYVARVTIRAQVVPNGGSERWAQVTRDYAATHRFHIRYRGDIDETWRLRWREEEFAIRAILPGGRRLREFIDLIAVASGAENPRT